ncbi:Protein SMAX1-LIKE 6 [Linum grandiflorum]
MPTPVSTARQCLTPEAAHALDEAVRVAKKRGHGQTTSLHAVSALLSFPSSALRDACTRARNSAYSTRLQFKALDLCLSVSLDRVPSSGVGDTSPPVSNSLMAAIKRSQANQRRQPESFHLYHHQFSSQSINFNQLAASSSSPSSPSSSSSSVSCIRVDLRNLIMSILDDPVVSRVFSDAGFRSSEIKLAVFRPIPLHLKTPPLAYSDPGRKNGFAFQFPGSFPGFFSGDENFRRIGEVLGRSQGRNPLLLGVCACDELANFVESVQRRKKDGDNILPPGLSGLSVIRLESEIYQFLSRRTSDHDNRDLEPRLEEVGRSLDRDPGPGSIVSFGDLDSFVKNEDGAVSYVVEKLTRLLQQSSSNSKLWLIGAAASYETYSKFVGRFPCIVKDWDLQLLPITSVTRASSSFAAESYPKSSLMESFIPFGGFFSTPSDFKVPLGSPYQYMTQCFPCNEQESVALSRRSSVPTMTDQYHQPHRLPSWLQVPERATARRNDLKIRDDKDVLSCRAASLQIEQDFMCHSQSPAVDDIHPPKFPTIMGFRLEEDGKRGVGSENDSTTHLKAASSVTIDSQHILRSDSAAVCFPAVIGKQGQKHSNEDTESGGALKSPRSFSNSSMCYGSQASPSSVNSMTMDLGLRISSAPPDSGITDVNGSICISDLNATTRSSQSSPKPIPQYSVSNFKDLFRYLSERVGWQNEAISIISETIADCRTRDGNGQGRNIWFSFLGPDSGGKRKVAAAIAEIIYGTKENFVYANLDPQDGFSGKSWMSRGKTVVDYVAGELCRRPISVVLLENVDKADVQVQNSLSCAVQTGKFSDSHGREVSINNAIIITTSAATTDGKNNLLSQTYSEEKLLRAKGLPIRILIEKDAEKQLGQDLTLSVNNSNKSNSIFKRKLTGMNQTVATELAKRVHKEPIRCLDLNLPAQENDLALKEGDNLDHSNAWLQGFYSRVDRVVEFKPFDFDALANRISNEIKKSFQKFVDIECSLAIDPKVMEQLLATAYISDQNKTVEHWIDQVLGCEFAQVKRKHGELNGGYTLKIVACDVEETDSPRVWFPPRLVSN